jgi:hypothetical protein
MSIIRSAEMWKSTNRDAANDGAERHLSIEHDLGRRLFGGVISRLDEPITNAEQAVRRGRQNRVPSCIHDHRSRTQPEGLRPRTCCARRRWHRGGAQERVGNGKEMVLVQGKAYARRTPRFRRPSCTMHQSAAPHRERESYNHDETRDITQATRLWRRGPAHASRFAHSRPPGPRFRA